MRTRRSYLHPSQMLRTVPASEEKQCECSSSGAAYCDSLDDDLPCLHRLLLAALELATMPLLSLYH